MAIETYLKNLTDSQLFRLGRVAYRRHLLGLWIDVWLEHAERAIAESEKELA